MGHSWNTTLLGPVHKIPGRPNKQAITVTKKIKYFLRAKDAEINKERGEIERFKRSLQTQVQDLQIELEKQRAELKTEFDECMRKREHEWRIQAEEFSSTILARDLEVR